jgi:hypothetical protein
MDLATLYDMAPWEWPEDANKLIYDVLTNRGAAPDDRVMAAELAGEQVVMDDRMAGELLSILLNKQEPEELRENAAVSLGPVLDYSFTMEFDDPDEIIITEKTYQGLRQSLKKMYHDADISENLRRRVLETLVRAPEDWQQGAVRAAYTSKDEEWRRTAVFGMGFVGGFDEQIVESLLNPDPVIHYHAVAAAGNWQIDAAWPHVVELVSSEDTERDLLLAAIEAAIFIRPREAAKLLERFLESDDEEIMDTIAEALAMVGEVVPDDYLEDDEA